MRLFSTIAQHFDTLWTATFRFFGIRRNLHYSPLLPDHTVLEKSKSGLRNRLSGWSLARRIYAFVLLVFVFVFLIVSGTVAKKHVTHASPPRHGLAEPGMDHPIKLLVELAEDRFISLQSSQSSTLEEAIAEYRRRYTLPPPPRFDRWYEYAIQHDTEMIDEYDTIYDSLILFWGMEPSVIRKRTRRALDGENGLIAAEIRDGIVKVLGSGQDNYQGPAIQTMISKFSQWLPDMDLAFNVHDEARVLVPHEDSARLMTAATASMSATQAARPINNYSETPENQQNSATAQGVYFNHMNHQQTFTHSCMSCPLDSPSRNLEHMQDAWTGYTYDGITFVDNLTSHSDICQRPSIRPLVAMFNHPNVFSVSHGLIPIFTPSKPSTFHAIIYPSYYYYTERASYRDNSTVPWDEKNPHPYWRGATSGGYSEGGSWRGFLRQSILLKLSAEGTTRVLNRGIDKPDSLWWSSVEIERSTVKDRYDAKFTEIKQCSPEDCSEMQQQFGTHEHASQEEAWQNRYLLDLDGNAHSGRFYALLKSLSLPLKVAYNREWHADRIFPWLHYVPVSSSTDEYAEILRYFEDEEEGQVIAQKLALQGRNWAHKTVRASDMEVYLFRLLLEYGRIVDDDRQNIGYGG